MADEANCSIVLALLQVAFHGKCDDQGLDQRGWLLFQINVRAVITASPPVGTSSAGMLSTPADYPFFDDCTAASTPLRRMTWSYSVCLGTVQY